MNNVFVYLEIEGTTVADVSLELLTKGRKLANQLLSNKHHLNSVLTHASLYLGKSPVVWR